MKTSYSPEEATCDEEARKDWTINVTKRYTNYQLYSTRGHTQTERENEK